MKIRSLTLLALACAGVAACTPEQHARFETFNARLQQANQQLAQSNAAWAAGHPAPVVQPLGRVCIHRFPLFVISDSRLEEGSCLEQTDTDG
ncbi:hypothetical protein, partial [Acidocella facilis]|uniref:hypothetical protein n=1 Tax=Acidocella facilis TaxID=525 RepID=UPI001B809E6F